jgi:hypothetical protein
MAMATNLYYNRELMAMATNLYYDRELMAMATNLYYHCWFAEDRLQETNLF